MMEGSNIEQQHNVPVPIPFSNSKTRIAVNNVVAACMTVGEHSYVTTTSYRSEDGDRVENEKWARKEDGCDKKSCEYLSIEEVWAYVDMAAAGRLTSRKKARKRMT
jgi:hypothetical protein